MPITLHIKSEGGWDEVREEFTDPVNKKVTLEHSLQSLYKWEAHYHKPFLTSEKSREETLYYLSCMTLNEEVDPSIYALISQDQMLQLQAYINDSMTATTIKEDPRAKKNKKIQTAETIYSMMFELGIPMEWDQRHLNQLLMMISVRAEEQKEPRKMSKDEIRAQNRALNEARRAKSKGKR